MRLAAAAAPRRGSHNADPPPQQHALFSLVEDSIQLASKNPFPCSSAGSTLSHWSLGNHSGLTQRSSDGELCCTFMWASLERARGHLVWISLPFTSTSPVTSQEIINNSWGWYCMRGWTLWTGLFLPSVTGADGSECASPERSGQWRAAKGVHCSLLQGFDRRLLFLSTLVAGGTSPWFLCRRIVSDLGTAVAGLGPVHPAGSWLMLWQIMLLHTAFSMGEALSDLDRQDRYKTCLSRTNPSHF